MPSMKTAILVWFVTGGIWLAAATALGQTHWPQFRGADSSGVAAEAKPPVAWSPTENVVWKREIPGKGWSSPIVWGDKIFLTTAVADAPPAVPRKGLYVQGLKGVASEAEHRWMVYCLDWETGKVLWEKTAHQGVPSSAIHAKNSYASETPTTDGEVLVACFGAVGVFCYDMAGGQLWSHTWTGPRMRMGWGTAASPLLYQDRVYLVNDNETSSFLVALDKRSGKQIWRVPRDEKSSWTTPLLWKNRQRTEIVTVGSSRVRSYSLDGKPLWELEGLSSISIPTPTATADLLIVASGYVADSYRPVYAIRPGASGDITLKDDAASNEYVAWSLPAAAPYNPSPLLYGDYLYLLYDRGMLACYEVQTGKEVYARQRLAADRASFAASPWACDGKIFCLSEDAETFVVQAGREFKVLGRNRLDDTALASPAVVRNDLILRTLSTVYRIGPGGH